MASFAIHQALVLSFAESLCTVDKKWTHQDIIFIVKGVKAASEN